jgi:hypothetical protein
MDQERQPGNVTQPSAAPQTPPVPPTAQPTPVVIQPTTPPTYAELPQYPAYAPQPSSTAAGLSEYESSATNPPLQGGIVWQADEFEGSSKSATWYGSVVLGAILAAIAVFFVTGKDFFVAGAVLIAVLGLAYLASRRPSSQVYAVDDQGVHTGNKLRAYEEFRCFAVSEEGQLLNLVFTPHKRFAPPLVIPVTVEQEQPVIDLLTAYLPLEEHKPDAVDALIRRIRL